MYPKAGRQFCFIHCLIYIAPSLEMTQICEDILFYKPQKQNFLLLLFT